MHHVCNFKVHTLSFFEICQPNRFYCLIIGLMVANSVLLRNKVHYGRNDQILSKNMRHFDKIGKNLIQTHEQFIQVQFFAISNQKMTLYRRTCGFQNLVWTPG